MYQSREFGKLEKPEKKYCIPVLEKFLNFGNHSMLIKGETGTGKLTLCFEFANLVQDKHEIYFITKSQNNDRIYRRASWIKSFLPATNIIDINSKGGASVDEDFEVYETLNAISTMSSMINDPFISENIKKPFIILDSWNKIVEHIDEKKKTRVEKTILSMIEKNDGFIIFLSEGKSISSIEDTVDGVIDLIHEGFELYTKRKMIFEKLNGMAAIPPTVPFTLHEGRFRTFSKLKNEKILNPNYFIPIPNTDERYSTGNNDWDSKLEGGFKKGSVIGFEIDESVDRFVFVPLFAPMVLNFLSHNNPVIVAAPADQNIKALTSYIRPYIEKETFIEKFRIVGPDFHNKSDPTIEQNYSNADSIQKKMMEHYSSFKQKNEPVLFEMDCSLIELAYQKKIESIQNDIVTTSRQIRNNNDLLILSTRPGYKSTDIIKSVSDLYFHISNYEGVIVLSTEKPQMFLANIQSNYERGYPCMDLLESS